MSWRLRYAMEQQHYDKLQGAAEKFFGGGGSVEIHHIGDGTQPDAGKAQYFKQQQQHINSQLLQATEGTPQHLALTGLSNTLGGLHQIYSGGGTKGLPGELWSAESGHSTQTLLAKGSNGNITGHLTTFDMPKSQTNGESVSGVVGTSSINSGTATALQHTLVHQVLKSTDKSLASTIYDQAGPVQDNARKFHDSIGRNVSGLDSWWTPSDVKNITNSTSTVPGANITHVGEVQ